MAGNTPIRLSRKSQSLVGEYVRSCHHVMNNTWNMREQMRNTDLAYMRELDWTKENKRAETANRYGDANRFRNVTIPIIMPQVEAAVTYQTSVFLTGTPIFDVVAPPEFMDQAMQMSTVIEDEQVRGGWVSELIMMFRDGFKYNLGGVELDWKREVTAAVETDITFDGGKQGKPKEVIWQGNSLKRLDMYNTFFDARVKPTEIHKKGEFAGYTEVYSRTALKSFLASLPDRMVENEHLAFASSYAGTAGGSSLEGYYVPQLNENALLSSNQYRGFDWLSWMGVNNQNVKNTNGVGLYQVTTIYARIIPADFDINVPSRNVPQVWKFIIVNYNIIVYAERQTNAHGWIPMLFVQPLEDGLGYQTKSLAENVRPIQELTTALANSAIAARRRAVSDRMLYDPSRINEAVINSANPSAKMPVRPQAFGKPLSEAVYPIPFRDDQSGIIFQEIAQFSTFANQISGQNPVKQGQFVKGNKTQREFDTVMGNANGRDQMAAIHLESALFTPLKEMIKINILQYQGGVELYSRSREQLVKVDPVALRKAIMSFKISDGLTPTDKLISADAFTMSIQTIGSSPAIGAGYNLAPAFSYLMKTQGADLRPFEKSPEQVAYESAVQSWQQLALEAMKSGVAPENLPPQPLPEQFGYQPATGGPMAPGPTPAPKINNITNNITNNVQGN